MMLPHRISPVFLFRADFDASDMTILTPYILFAVYIVMISALNYFLMRKKIREG
jgi:hypothetical protein